MHSAGDSRAVLLPPLSCVAAVASGMTVGSFTLGTAVARSTSVAVFRVRESCHVLLKFGDVASIKREACAIRRLRHVPGVAETLPDAECDERNVHVFGGCAYIILRNAGMCVAPGAGGATSNSAECTEATQRRAAAITLAVLETLLAVHTNGIVHGNVKAHNILAHADTVGGAAHGSTRSTTFAEVYTLVGFGSSSNVSSGSDDRVAADLVMLLWAFLELAVGEQPGLDVRAHFPDVHVLPPAGAHSDGEAAKHIIEHYGNRLQHFMRQPITGLVCYALAARAKELSVAIEARRDTLLVALRAAADGGSAVSTGLRVSGFLWQSNNCHLLSVLQACLALVQLSADTSQQSQSQRELLCGTSAVEQSFESLRFTWRAGRTPVSVSPFLEVCRERASTGVSVLKSKHQEDAHETLTLLFSVLPGLAGQSEFVMTETKTCVHGASFTSSRNELGLLLPVPSEERGVLQSLRSPMTSDLAVMLRRALDTENISWMCSCAKQTLLLRKQASKKESYISFRQFLVIQLMRFANTRGVGARKLHTAVNIAETISMPVPESDAQQFQLRGVVEHRGCTLQSGHYVAHVRGVCCEEDTWRECDNDSVGTTRSTVDVLAHVQTTCYLLFYRKVSGRAPAT